MVRVAPFFWLTVYLGHIAPLKWSFILKKNIFLTNVSFAWVEQFEISQEDLMSKKLKSASSSRKDYTYETTRQDETMLEWEGQTDQQICKTKIVP